MTSLHSAPPSRPAAAVVDASPAAPFAAATPRTLHLRGGRTATLRPVRPDDAARMQVFVTAALSATSRRLRFHGAVNGCSDAALRRLTCADGGDRVAFVATVFEHGSERIVGEARYAVAAADAASAEFAIAVADAWQGCGLADALIDALAGAAREAGLRWLLGDVLAGNARMLAFMHRCGFVASACGSDDGMVRMERGVSALPRRGAGRVSTTIGQLQRCGWLGAFGSHRVAGARQAASA